MTSDKSQNYYALKIAVIGDLAVGKTSLIKQFVEGKFSIDYMPTIGTNMFTTTTTFTQNGDVFKVRLNIYDIAGQESWKSMRHAYYRGTNGVLIVGDLTRKDTFDKIISYWIKDMREYIEEDVPFILLANKSDLVDLIEISEEDVASVARVINAPKYFITSAKNGSNVRESFKDIAIRCLDMSQPSG